MKQHYSIEWLTEQMDKGKSLKFLYFWGHTPKQEQAIDNSCFSQWFPSSFTIDDLKYKTAEHWMMAQKALLFKDQDIFEQIIDCNSPGEAKKLGRKVRGFDEDIWNEHRLEIVVQGNIHKFSQNPNLKSYLLNTGHRVLVEASPVDSIWGIGLSKNNRKVHHVAQWRGLNLLGFALMEAREVLGKADQ